VTGATVLIVDDSLVIRAVVRDGLETEGYQVTEAIDGLAGLQRCRENPPDVVLLDIEMPGLDGYGVLAALKGDPILKDIPVVFLTSRAGMEDVVAGLRGGAHDYLKKPFETVELLARVGSAASIKRLQDQLRERNAELDLISRIDVLTGLFNRRHLDGVLQGEFADSHRHVEPLCVLLFDLDHFKLVNDTYGHLAGDAVLRAFAGRVRAELRVGDTSGRWGGEEFLVILPRTDIDGGLEVAERIRASTSAEPVVVGEASITVTVSGGCVVGPGNSVQELVELADHCMYQAKVAGRDQIVTATV